MQKKSLLSCLVCLIVMWAGAFANEVQSLLDSASAAYNSNRYEECADLYGLAFEQGVRNKNVSYNAACCCALNGDVDRAIACLYTAVELGYHNTEWLQADSDLQ
ncbi:MAG: hypothetical protein GY867_08940, partial [bacterium]|nr:hypothetical protein [bacterium]